jgi:mannose-6-phosphate isomerase
MSQELLYPLRFEPIYQYRLWGGRRLAGLLTAPLPGDGPIGEAWVLSDREDHPSRVADGPLKGRTIAQLLEQFPQQVMGKLAGRFRRFPLLLKFLDAREMLSVQVHPADTHTDLLPAGETGKTEAWVVLEAGPKSRIYAGLRPGVTEAGLRQAIANGGVADQLAYITPQPGDAVFIPAGTVHSLGGDIVVFEVQENSDVTFRLYDWNHVDAKTGKPRALQVDQALACVDFGSVRAVWWRPWWKPRRPWNASGSFTVNSFGCRDCTETHRLPSAPRVCRECWYASKAPARSSTAAPLMLSEKATCFCCRR